MRTNCCHKFIAFNLKFLNFLQLFLGISTVIYSSYLLYQWQNQSPIDPSPPPHIAPSPNYLISVASIDESYQYTNYLPLDNVDVEFVSGSEIDSFSNLHFQLPAPWFIYFLMVVGVLLCCMSCIGHIAAEAFNGCCLCFYILFSVVIITLEAASVAYIAIDRHWDKDLPYDATGELEKLKLFVKENADVCEWLGIALLAIQALSLLLSLVLRAMVSTERTESDVETGEAAARERMKEPLLNSQSYVTVKGEGRGAFSDMLTTRIRQKYGLNSESSKNQSQSAPSSAMP